MQPRILAVSCLLTALALATPACGDDGAGGAGGGGNGGTGGSGGSGGTGGTGACQPDAFHCDFTGFCIQYSTESGPKETCAAASGTWAAGPCSAHGIGGCRSNVGAECKIEWYPASEDATAMRTACEASGGTWVEP